MPIQSSGPIKLSDLEAEFGGEAGPVVPPDRMDIRLSNYYAGRGNGFVPADAVGYPNGVATPIPSTIGSTLKLSNFYGSSDFNFQAYIPPTYNQTPVILAYFDSVDREVYWGIDIRSMGSRWWTHWSDFNFNSFTFSNANLPGISQPELYSSVSIDTAGSSGRGGVYVYQQPSAANGWIGIINTNDNPQGSRAPYVLRINITATAPSSNFSSPNLWFDKTAILVNSIGAGAPNSATVTALYHPSVTLTSITWSGAAGFTLSGVNSQTVTISNPNNYDEGSYQFGTYNIRGSTLTCTAVLRVNGINYTVSKNIYVHATIAYPPAPPGDYGGWFSANFNSTSEQGSNTDNSSTESVSGTSNDGTELERPISPEEPINEVVPLPSGWIPPEIPVIDINDIPLADTNPPAEQ